MTTTSFKLPGDLKKGAATAAHDLGVSPHAFVVAAIEQAAKAIEQRVRFIAEAKAAQEEMIETGKGFDVADVHAFLKAKVPKKNVTSPKLSAWHA